MSNRALLMLSGGIDSAYCLWLRAKEGLPTRTHHVHLYDHEGRGRVEAKATQAVLDYVRGMGAEVEHTESLVDFKTQRWIPKNHHLWGYWAGVVLADPKGRDINEVIIPRHKDGVVGGPDGRHAAHIDRCFTGHIKLLTGRDITLVKPMQHMVKAEVIADMPRDLLNLCWYCRRPKRGKPCHECGTCKLVDPALEKL